MIQVLSRYLLLLLLFGCQTTPPVRIVVQPVVLKIDNALPILRGRIIFDGKEEYLPRTIGMIGLRHDGLTIRYEYEDADDRYQDYHRIQDDRFRSLLGDWYPSYTKVTVVLGRVTVLKGENILKSYKAIAAVSTPTKGGLTLTEMRRIGLLEVRDNIEGQMYQDSDYLRGLEE
jgi:hypothetical protein